MSDKHPEDCICVDCAMEAGLREIDKNTSSLASPFSSEVCCVCKWSNSTLNLGEFGNPKWVCHGCCKRMFDSVASYGAENARLRKECDRLRAWLQHIDGGDRPCLDESQLRQWAYEAITLSHPAPK